MMFHSFAFILSFGLLVPSIIAALSNLSEGSQTGSNDEDKKSFDNKENENVASNELTPVERKVIAVQEMIDQLKKYNAFWDKLSAAKSQESLEETSEEIPEPEKNPSERRKRIKYAKKKSKKSEESIDDESDSDEETIGSEEDKNLSDDSNMVPTHIREKGNVFSKKRLKDDTTVSRSENIDSDSVEFDNDVNRPMFTDTTKENTYDNEEGDYYREKKNPVKIAKNSEQTKSTSEKPSEKITILNTKEKSKQDEFENQLKGQKEIAEPIMFRNRSDGHYTTQKPVTSLLKISNELRVIAKYMPAIIKLKTDNGEMKRGFKTPESDEDLSSFSDQAAPNFYEFRDETAETPPYDFRREANQDLLNSDDSYVGAELLDDDILDTKGSALIAPSSDEHGQLKKTLNLLDQSNLKIFNEHSSEETTEEITESNSNSSNNDNEDEKNNEQENNEKVLGSNDDTELEKRNGSLGRYHRIRDVSRQVAM